MTRKFLCLLTFLGVFLLAGCSVFQQSGFEKELFAWQMPKAKLADLKNEIVAAGYEKITAENYRYEGSYVTQYEKNIIVSPDADKRKGLNVMVDFKDENSGSGFYNNVGVTIYNARYNDPELEAEATKIESILYQSFVNLAGLNNVIRGKRNRIK